MSKLPEEDIPRPKIEEMSKIQTAQIEDPELFPFYEYLSSYVLPTEEKIAKKVVMESQRYELIEPTAFIGRLCVVVPKVLREALLQESHASCFSGHFSAKKVYDRLHPPTPTHWWRSMRADVYHFVASAWP